MTQGWERTFRNPSDHRVGRWRYKGFSRRQEGSWVPVTVTEFPEVV